MIAKPPDALCLERLPTPIGTALLVTDEAGVLRAFDFEDYEERMARLLRRHYGAANLAAGAAPRAVKDLVFRYFDGDFHALDEVRWATAGTPFQRGVWAALTTIPAGETSAMAVSPSVSASPRPFARPVWPPARTRWRSSFPATA